MSFADLIDRFGVPGAASAACAAAVGTAVIAVLTTDKTRLIPGLLLMTIGFFLFAWSEWERNSASAKQNALAEVGTRRLRLRLMWKHQFQFIGIYRAQAQLEAEGQNGSGPLLEVIEGGSPIGLDPRATVSHGLDDLGITSATALIRWFLKNRSTKDEQRLVPLLVIFRRSPACLIYRVQDPQSQNSQPKLTAAELSGKRFHVADRDDPATMEFRALCDTNGVQNVQWDPPVFSDDENDLTSNLQSGDYRLGYSFNEGYRSLHARSKNQEFRYDLLTSVFSKEALYADVLFTRKELLDNSDKKDRIERIVKEIQESYEYFVDPTQKAGERREKVNEYMQAFCRDWWHGLIGSNGIFDATARDLIELLEQAWSRMDSARLGCVDFWRELEEAILREMKQELSPLPHLQHLNNSDHTPKWFSQADERINRKTAGASF